MIREKHGDDRREPIHQPNLEQSNKKVTKKGKSAATQVYFATTPNKDTLKFLYPLHRKLLKK